MIGILRGQARGQEDRGYRVVVCWRREDRLRHAHHWPTLWPGSKREVNGEEGVSTVRGGWKWG